MSPNEKGVALGDLPELSSKLWVSCSRITTNCENRRLLKLTFIEHVVTQSIKFKNNNNEIKSVNKPQNPIFHYEPFFFPEKHRKICPHISVLFKKREELKLNGFPLYTHLMNPVNLYMHGF